MRLSVLILASAMLTGAPALAQESRELELAHRIIQLSEVERPMLEMIDSLGPIVAQPLRADGGFTEEDIDQFVSIFREEFLAELPALLDIVAQTYARRFSASEMEQVIAFLETPVGRRWAELQTEMMQDIEAEALAIGERVGQRTVTRFQDYIERKADQ